MNFEPVKVGRVYLISYGDIRVRVVKSGSRYSVEQVSNGRVLLKNRSLAECQEFIEIHARHNPPGVFEVTA